MLFIAVSLHLVQHIPYRGNSRRVWVRGKVILTVKCADNLVLLAKKETCYVARLID
jgi:hypothetical protein